MNTEKIKYFIQNPLSITKDDVEIIEEVKNLFPYSSTLHMLYIKGLANANSIKFESELKKAAIHVNDRERLHDLVHLKEKTNDIVQNETEAKPKIVINEPIKDIKVEQNIVLKTQTQEKATVKKGGKLANKKPDMAKIIADIQLKVEKARRVKENKLEETNKKEKKIEELPTVNLITSIEDNKTEVVFSEPIDEVESVKDYKQEKLSVDLMAHAMEVAFELDVDNIIRDFEPEKNNEVAPEKEEKVKAIDVNALSFTEWLKYKQGKLKIIEVEVSEPEETIKLTKKDINSLLDRFIEEEPRMKKPQKEFFSPVKNARDSLEDSTVLVSETLAKIYWMQKKYDKAIKAYQQLSLRNPEKSIIFANQIKKIKKELNKI